MAELAIKKGNLAENSVNGAEKLLDAADFLNQLAIEKGSAGVGDFVVGDCTRSATQHLNDSDGVYKLNLLLGSFNTALQTLITENKDTLYFIRR